MSITLARKYRVLALVKEAAPDSGAGYYSTPGRPGIDGNPLSTRNRASSGGRLPRDPQEYARNHSAPPAAPASVRAAPPQARPVGLSRAATPVGLPGDATPVGLPGDATPVGLPGGSTRTMAPTRISATQPAAPAESAFARSNREYAGIADKRLAFERSNREYAGIADKRLAALAPSGKASVAPSGSSASQPSSSVKMEKGKGYAYLASKWGGGVTAGQVRAHLGGRMLHAGKDYARPDAATLASIGKLTAIKSKFTLGAKKTAPAAPAAARAPQPQANTLSAPKPQFSTDGMNRMPGAEVRSPNAGRTPWTPK